MSKEAVAERRLDSLAIYEWSIAMAGKQSWKDAGLSMYGAGMVLESLTEESEDAFFLWEIARYHEGMRFSSMPCRGRRCSSDT